jgi:acetoacetate decarboxylase
MGLKGKLSKAKMGTNMPVDAPAYANAPFHFKGSRFLRFDYETNADTAAELIPEQLQLPDPPTAFLLINDYPWSTFGPYKEAILGVNVLFGSQPLHYLSHLMLDSSCPILGGREIYGVPKKMGVVELVQHEDVMAGYVERPKGIRICSGVLRPEQPLDSPAAGTALNACTLRVIPSPEKDKVHSLVELIQEDMILSSGEVWSGPGNCHFAGTSVLDPWHNLPVAKMISATYMVCDWTLSPGKILATL